VVVETHLLPFFLRARVLAKEDKGVQVREEDLMTSLFKANNFVEGA
jgi:hypothetical protein